MRQITEEVGAVLRDGYGIGSTFYLGTGALDRDVYMAVDRVLKGLGGKWNRKSRGHVFPDDPMPAIKLAIANSAYQDRAHDLQLFETPWALVGRMVAMARIDLHDEVLEPSAGRGRIVRGLLAKTTRVTAIDIDDQNIQALRSLAGRLAPAMEVIQANFIQWGAIARERIDCRFAAVVMNPPFTRGQDIEHVMVASAHLRPGGRLVAIMSEGPFFRGDRKALAFREWLEATRGTSERLPEATFKESGTKVETRLVIIDRPQGGGS